MLTGLSQRIRSIYHSLISRLILLVGIVLFGIVSAWAYFNINYYKTEKIDGIIQEVDRLGNTIMLGTHYAMMLNSREDINNIINNIGRQEDIRNIRIYNKQGEIKFSNHIGEVEQKSTIRDEACFICHKREPPLEEVGLSARSRFFTSPEGHRLIGVITPIYNEPACSNDACHFHPQNKRVLGAIDVVMSLQKADESMRSYERRIITLTILAVLATSAIIAIFLNWFVNRPIQKLITRTRSIAKGQFEQTEGRNRSDEIGQLAFAIDHMGREIRGKQEELNRQRYEYQELFEQVPCYVTVHNRELRLLNYNREFSNQFAPMPGDYCYRVYKGQTKRCDPCPVLQTFEDGEPHSLEETGVARDGTVSHWIGKTSPIRDNQGEILAVMEMSLNITPMKRLEEEIRKSEENYRSIFNKIPNPIFVLDTRNLTILDCNDSVGPVYGFTKEEIIGTPFLNFFEDGEEQQYGLEMRRTDDILSKAKQKTKDGRTIYVNIRISPSEYLGRSALLVSTSDVTKKLMAEQQLIQASKMATLGEMATGIAHELNQPLTVMKTASNFLIKKVHRGEAIKPDILKTMAEEIDRHVDRASKIINHLREFGRKSEVIREHVDVNVALEKALDIFSQQLKLRGIEVVKDLKADLPTILGDANRLEQVFINLLINARDAIEERVERESPESGPKQILLKTGAREDQVIIEIHDTGLGIPKSILDKIFEPFFTTKRVGKGTGLGLSISYGIVQDYEGTIRVETREHQGSTFIIQFPIPRAV